jgi:hypothetical protein
MLSHLRRVCTVKNKLVNSVQVLCQFHKRHDEQPNYIR